MKNDLSALDSWADNIGLEFYVIKCLIFFYKNRVPLEFSYSLSSTVLANLGNPVNDLGILLYQNLNFHAHIHIEAFCYKILKTVGFLKRICNEYKLLAPFKTLFCAFVRFILELGVI